MKLSKLNKKVFPIILVGFLLAQPFFVSALINVTGTCADECAYIGQTDTSGDSYRFCGDYDSDCCYEWSQWYTNPPTCADECAYVGQHECSGTSGKTCGNYDSDCCLEWSSWQSCDSQCYYCGDGTCNSSCGETSYNCSSDCGCLSPLVVDIKADNSNGPITVSYKDNITLSWSSENSVSCQASGDWSGTKAVSGSQVIQMNEVKTNTFTLACEDATGTKTETDSVIVIVTPNPPVVITKPAIITY